MFLFTINTKSYQCLMLIAIFCFACCHFFINWGDKNHPFRYDIGQYYTYIIAHFKHHDIFFNKGNSGFWLFETPTHNLVPKGTYIMSFFYYPVSFIADLFSESNSLGYTLYYDFETKHENINPKYLIDTLKHSGSFCSSPGPENPYCPAIEIAIAGLTKKSYTSAKGACWTYSKYPVEELSSGLIIELKHKGFTFKYKGYSISSNNFKPNVWNKGEYYMLTPDNLRSTKDLVRTYFWNNCKHTIYVDDLMMEAYEPIIDKSVF